MKILATPSPSAIAILALGVACGSQRAAIGETLGDALALAYETNPSLVSQRAQLAAISENYVQAEAGFRPTVSGQVTISYSKAPQSSIFGTEDAESNVGFASATVSQPLYTGGRVTAHLDAATAQIAVSKEQLRGVEQAVAFSVIQAYADVLRDRELLGIQRNSYKTLWDATEEIRSRFGAGAATITDRDQAEAQLASSRALVISAQAQVEVSVAEYKSAVGQDPGQLAPLPKFVGLPPDIETAFDICEQESPIVGQATFNEAVAAAGVREAKASLRPEVTLSGSWGALGPIAPYVARDYMKDVSASITLNQPIFTGGLLSSQIRQARAEEASARAQVEVVRRSVVQAVGQAWALRAAALANARLEESAASAAQATFEGIRVEYRAGLRSTLDVLTAQETLRDDTVAAASARHDSYVAEASLIESLGRLEIKPKEKRRLGSKPLQDLGSHIRGGSVPWQFVPRMLDHVAAPK